MIFDSLSENTRIKQLTYFFFLQKVLIIEFGGQAFQTAKLSPEHWAWCLFFGVGVLVWGQVISTMYVLFFVVFI